MNYFDVDPYIQQQLLWYPKMELQDLIKLLYQREFGSGHLMTDETGMCQRILEECLQQSAPPPREIEAIGSNICRLHLWEAFSPYSQVIQKLFSQLAEAASGSSFQFQHQLTDLLHHCETWDIPFSGLCAREYIPHYLSMGCPMLSHSASYKKLYHPSYRLIEKKDSIFLSLFFELFQELSSDRPIVIAIDGTSASGKTTLAHRLSQLFQANVIHMDDFFLRPEQKTEERQKEPGGNIDYERFLTEVAPNVRKRTPFYYQKYDCQTQTFTQKLKVAPRSLLIVEGAYSFSPRIQSIYDWAVFLHTSPKTQKQRILLRNGPELWNRFEKEWIPKENSYIEFFSIKQHCKFQFNTEELN